MLLVLLIIFWLVYLYFGWPSRVAHCVKKHHHVEKQSNIFAIVVLFIFITIYITLVLLGETTERAWQQTAPAFNALAISAAIVFTAVRLFPPTFHALFSKVIDYETGACSNERVYMLEIPKGKEYPVSLAMVNTGTFTWDNFRITLDLSDSFEIMESAKEKFPSCDKWNHAPAPGSLIIGKGYLQKKSTSVLTIGETLATRFFVKAKDIGEYKMTIMMTSAGRIGERRESLKIRVVENEQKKA